MSEVAAIKKPGTKPEQVAMAVRIVGKITRMRRHDQHIYTTVICPAKDAYSRPSVVELRSRVRIGDPEQEIDVFAELGGYEGKPYRVQDRDTGDSRMAIPVNHYLDYLGA